jgi:hypothetical protein
MKISFTNPSSFWLICGALPLVLACILVAGWFYLAGRKGYGEMLLVRRFSRNPSLTSHLFFAAGYALVPVCLIVAAAGPYLPSAMRRVPAGNQDVVLVVQVSRDMGATDYANKIPDNDLQFFNQHGTRLNAVKYEIRHGIMPSLLGNQLALVAYQGESQALVDLTDSFDYVDYIVDQDLTIGAAPFGDYKKEGKISDIAAALRGAIEQFDAFSKKDSRKTIVLFSTGDNVSGDEDLQKVEDKIRDRGIKVIVVGLGGAPVPIPVFGGDQNQFLGYYLFRNGAMPLTGINEEQLKQIAAATNGQYMHLDPLHLPNLAWNQELTEYKLEPGRLLIYQWPAGIALGLVLLLGMAGALAKLIETSKGFFATRKVKQTKGKHETD